MLLTDERWELRCRIPSAPSLDRVQVLPIFNGFCIFSQLHFQEPRTIKSRKLQRCVADLRRKNAAMMMVCPRLSEKFAQLLVAQSPRTDRARVRQIDGTLSCWFDQKPCKADLRDQGAVFIDDDPSESAGVSQRMRPSWRSRKYSLIGWSSSSTGAEGALAMGTAVEILPATMTFIIFAG